MLVTFIIIFINTCEAQKGGAKSAMRNRGKSGGRGGASRVGGGNRAVAEEGGGRYSGAGETQANQDLVLDFVILGKNLISFSTDTQMAKQEEQRNKTAKNKQK